MISFLSFIEPWDQAKQPLEQLVPVAIKPGKKTFSMQTHKKAAEEAWLTVLRSNLTEQQRRRLLDLIPNSIAPWFNRPEMLTDFLVDSFNSGGPISLTALSGLFYLIKHRNLDYPQFYVKVYSLIDSYTLHSKQRSRFLRLLNIFLSSTHLPAALVASFMKRLSRLCLHSPPSGVIAIVPLIYNLIKEHPTCAFMIHRKLPGSSTNEEFLRGQDPFDPEQRDPLKTNAIDSSLWEIETLQTHFHPNVATIATIISKQFTKQSYKVEDFLDYTYDGVSPS
jgi:U3 small nucleolar RNA-associated protein 19